MLIFSFLSFLLIQILFNFPLGCGLRIQDQILFLALSSLALLLGQVHLYLQVDLTERVPLHLGLDQVQHLPAVLLQLCVLKFGKNVQLGCLIRDFSPKILKISSKNFPYNIYTCL